MPSGETINRKADHKWNSFIWFKCICTAIFYEMAWRWKSHHWGNRVIDRIPKDTLWFKHYIIIEGTFKLLPRLFQQLYTIHTTIALSYGKFSFFFYSFFLIFIKLYLFCFITPQNDTVLLVLFYDAGRWFY